MPGEVAGRRRSPALIALASLGRVWAERAVTRILAEEPIDGLTSSAVALVDSWGDPSHDPALLALDRRSSSPRPPNPFLRAHVVELVLRRYRADTLPLDLRDQLLEVLREDGHGSEATLAQQMFLLEPAEGLRRLSRALHHQVPMARHQAAACLVVIGTSEAAEILRTAGTEDAKAALALMRGMEPEPGPEPVGEVIDWRGRPRRVFRIDEIEAASLGSWVKAAVDELNSTFGALLERWWAS